MVWGARKRVGSVPLWTHAIACAVTNSEIYQPILRSLNKHNSNLAFFSNTYGKIQQINTMEVCWKQDGTK